MIPHQATPSPPSNGNTRTIARNSFWYGIETAATIVFVFAVSIPMARVIGPTKLGYFNYIMWLANTTGLIGSLGIPATTRKYMAEYLGKGEGRIARAIFFYTFRTQIALASLMTFTALGILCIVGDPAYRLVSLIQVLSTLPSMAGFVPAQANTATENMKANVFGSILGTCVQIAAVWLSLWLGWQLLGVAIGMLVARSCEFTVRLIPVLRWVRTLPEGDLPEEVRLKMRSFSAQGTVLMILNIVVWDRSDIVFLKMFAGSIAQVTFFSVAFNLTEKVTLATQVFAGALGASVMAQHGRDRSRVPQMVSASVPYMLLWVLPMLMGMAALSPAIIRLLYGAQYIPVIPVLAVAALFAIPKPMMLPAEQLLQANERQVFLICWSGFCGAINCLVDYLLIPKHGALGAVIGNGIAQTLASFGIWAMVLYRFRLPLAGKMLLKIFVSSLGMALLVLWLTWRLPPAAALATAIPIGGMVFVALLRLTSAMNQDDRRRLLLMIPALPAVLRPVFLRSINILAPEAT